MKNLSEKSKIKNKNKFKINIINLFRKILKIFLYLCIIILITYNIIYVYNKNYLNKEHVKIFNIYISVEKEDSMKPVIKKNDLIIGKKIKTIKDIKEDDIIGYDIDNTIKYHRLVNIKKDNGETRYITKADNNYQLDIEEKDIKEIKSKIIINIPMVGFIFKLFESRITSIIIILAFILRLNYIKYKIEKIDKRNKIIKEVDKFKKEKSI